MNVVASAIAPSETRGTAGDFRRVVPFSSQDWAERDAPIGASSQRFYRRHRPGCRSAPDRGLSQDVACSEAGVCPRAHSGRTIARNRRHPAPAPACKRARAGAPAGIALDRAGVDAPRLWLGCSRGRILGNQVSGRHWGDALGVLRVQGASLDRDYLEIWARRLRNLGSCISTPGAPRH